MTPSNYLVTGIITTKDRPQLIIRAVESVLKQTHRKIEIILVDDSDGCDTQQNLCRFAQRIRYIKNGKSSGACYCRNVGLSEARGDFIAFLDDDDFWMPEKIEMQLRLADQYPLVGCNYISYSDRKRVYVRQPRIVNYKDMLYHNYLGSCSFVLAEATAVKKCRFDESVSAGQDWDMWLSVMKENKIRQAANAPEYLAGYSQGSHSRISNTVKNTRAVLFLYEKRIDEYDLSGTTLFGLYHFVKADKSPIVWIFREWVKARLKNKGVLFFIRMLFMRLFGVIEVL